MKEVCSSSGSYIRIWLYPEYTSMKFHSLCPVVVWSYLLDIPYSVLWNKCTSSITHLALQLVQGWLTSQGNRTLWILCLEDDPPHPEGPCNDLRLALFTFGALVLLVDRCSIDGTWFQDGSLPCPCASMRTHLSVGTGTLWVIMLVSFLISCQF